MRTTVTFADDVASAIEKVRRQRSVGVSEAVNDLIRAGLTAPESKQRFSQSSQDLGLRVDVTNVAEAVELLDGPSAS